MNGQATNPKCRWIRADCPSACHGRAQRLLRAVRSPFFAARIWSKQWVDGVWEPQKAATTSMWLLCSIRTRIVFGTITVANHIFFLGCLVSIRYEPPNMRAHRVAGSWCLPGGKIAKHHMPPRQAATNQPTNQPASQPASWPASQPASGYRF